MKRHLILLVAFLIVFSMLSGCGATNNNAAVTSTAAQAASASTVAEASTAAGEPQPGNPKLPLVTSPFTIKIWAPTSGNIQKTMSNLGQSDYYAELEKRTGVQGFCDQKGLYSF